jgi:hypothetical protein
MHTERLTILADYLDQLSAIPPDQRKREFNLLAWVKGATEENVCGTSACAVGEACCNIPTFQTAGLTLGLIGNSRTVEPIYRTGDVVYTNWDAVETFFDLENYTAEKLFQSEYYSTDEKADEVEPKAVADRIRKLLAQGDLLDVAAVADDEPDYYGYDDDEDDEYDGDEEDDF